MYTVKCATGVPSDEVNSPTWWLGWLSCSPSAKNIEVAERQPKQAPSSSIVVSSNGIPNQRCARRDPGATRWEAKSSTKPGSSNALLSISTDSSATVPGGP